MKESDQYFTSINCYYHITPTMEYYTCMVDLLTHSGNLDEVKDFINNMVIKWKETTLCMLFVKQYYSHIPACDKLHFIK